jgi:hypothetical protein
LGLRIRAFFERARDGVGPTERRIIGRALPGTIPVVTTA